VQNIFGFIIHPMELGLVWLATNVGSAGIGIILFTIFVRLVLSPLQIAQLRNAKAMQRLQPLMAELKQKHGKDKQKMTEATMALYKEHNVNPAMGCLPTVLQFPILIGLFYALLHLGQSPKWYQQAHAALTDTCNGHPVHGWAQWLHGCYAISGVSNTQHVFDLFHSNFLWLSNGLGAHDPLYILPVLAGITQWVQSRMMLTRSVDPQQQMMNNLMNFMPLMIVFFALRYASGLSLYWVTSTLIGIAIQYKITGLGLLPETLRGWAGILQARGAKPAGGSAKPPARPGKQTRNPSRSLNGQNGDPQRKESVSRPSANGQSNGSGEVSEAPQETTAVIRPRKKANRARGGRGGGRRG
jgi:YidC/Oxa1 family membrane protein insertase